MTTTTPNFEMILPLGNCTVRQMQRTRVGQNSSMSSTPFRQSTHEEEEVAIVRCLSCVSGPHGPYSTVLSELVHNSFRLLISMCSVCAPRGYPSNPFGIQPESAVRTMTVLFHQQHELFQIIIQDRNLRFQHLVRPFRISCRLD